MARHRNNFDLSNQPGRAGLSRRKFLRAGGLVIIASGAGGILVACGDDSTAVPNGNIVPGVESPSTPTAANTTRAAASGTSGGATSGATSGASGTTAATTKAGIDPGLGGGPTPTQAPATAAGALDAASRFLKLW